MQRQDCANTSDRERTRQRPWPRKAVSANMAVLRSLPDEEKALGRMSTLVCVSVAAEGTKAAIAAMAAAVAGGADLVELRLDLIPGFDLAALIGRRPCPVIVTYRPEREGGRFVGDESERLAVLRRAMALGAEYVDIEHDASSSLERVPGCRRIVSYHDFEGVPRPLEQLHRRLAALDADVVKIAVTARRIEDNLEVFRLLQGTDRPTIALAMGEAGVVSRLLAGRYGAFLTFASVEAGAAVAPGQVPLTDLLGMYRFRGITARTALYGVMANPVGHSMSPAVHNAAFRAVGLDAVYLPLLVQEPVSFLEQFTPLGFRGYSVTIPHKQTVIAALDEVQPLAARLESVNTIAVDDDGRKRGYNTDVEGALVTIEAALPPGETLKGKCVLLVGAGGLGRALAHGLTERGARLVLTNRTVERGLALAWEVGAEFVAMEEMGRVTPDVLVQTTSVGMHPRVEDSIVPAGMLRLGLVVYDAVYNPLETRLLREARRAGCRTVSGLGHFVNQAAGQFELWTDRPAPTDVMREALLAGLGAKD